MFYALQIIAERKITEFIQEGRLEVRNWKGRPLPMDDDLSIPAELRMAYKVLKNAGYLPPEVEAKKEISRLEELIAATEDEHTRLRQMKKLNALVLRLNVMRQKPVNLEVRDEYFRKVVERVSVSGKQEERTAGKSAG